MLTAVMAVMAACAATAIAGDEMPAKSNDRYARPAEGTKSEARVLFTENASLFAMNADGTDVRRIAPRSLTCKSASWSPDGRSIVLLGEFERTRASGGLGIYVVGADGEGLRKIAPIRSRFATRPVWSPHPTLDGEYLIVFSDTPEDHEVNCDLFAVRPDGTGLCNLTRSRNVKEVYPTWSPDAGRLAFVATYDRPLPPERKRCIPRWSKRVPEQHTRCVNDVMLGTLARDADGLLLVDRTNVTDVRGSELAFDRRAEDVHAFSELSWARARDTLAVVVRSARQRAQSDVWVIDLSEPRRARNVTRTKDASEASVIWSPDDSHLLFVRHALDEDGLTGVCMVPARRRAKPQLVLATAGPTPEDWQRRAATDGRGPSIDEVQALPR